MTTIIGIGNRFRGDDAVGLLVVKSLAGKVPADVRTIEFEGDQTRLLEIMQTTNAIIIVDAVQSSAAPGTVLRIDASNESIPRDFRAFTTHSLDSVQTIELARAMVRLPRKVIIYGIVGKDFSYAEKVSSEVEKSVENVRDKILEEIRTIV